MTHQQRLENPLYLNWIRGALGLKYLHEGLYCFVDAQIKKQHRKLINAITSTRVSSSDAPSICQQCTLENLLPDHALNRICIQRTKTKCFCKSRTGRRKCPNGICSRMYDLIVDEHAFSDPLWQNTNPQLWLTDHWSIAKCFLTNLCHTSSAKDTDTSGVLSIIINNLFLHKQFATSIWPPTDPFSKAREARNDIHHSPTLELQDVQMEAFIDTFIAVLQDKKILLHNVSAQNAVKHLSQLKSCQIYISLKDELQIRKDALQAIEEKRTEALNQIESAQANAIHALESHCPVKRMSAEATGAQEAESKEIMSSELSRIEALERINQRKVRKLDDRLKSSETSQLELEEKIDFNQEEIQRQIDTVKANQNIQEQRQSELTSQVKAMQEDVDAMKTSLTDLQHLKDRHEQCIDRLKQHADLQMELNAFYQQYYLKTDVSPLLPEEDVDVDEMYVSLMMERLCSREETATRKGEPIYFFEDMFFRRETSFKNIFVTADAGVGKTTLCRKLTSIWCKVHSDPEDFSVFDNIKRSKLITKENIEFKNEQTMKKFTYLFYVSLRHTNDENTIEEMIRVQLLTEKNKDLLTAILDEQPERCLVILDGLDEWNVPINIPKTPFITTGLPNKEVKRRYVTLYTTRPWKLENIRPRSGEIDVEIKLLGINSTAAGKLANNVVERLNKNFHTMLNTKDFIASLESKELSNLISIPILLKLLACLWHEERALGASFCDLYSSVIELLLRVAIERNINDEQFVNILTMLRTSGKGNLPTCFDNKSNCNALVALLKILSRLAFKALFESKQKASLVFEGSDLTKVGLSREEMYFCLKCGLLSQRLLPGKSAINRCKSVTFMHKTFQEFFAALHVVTAEEADVLPVVFSVCNGIQKVLEMGKVIQFIAGMSPAILFTISQHVMKLTDGDDRFISYRSIDSARTFITLIQDLLFLSIKESVDSGHVKLPKFKLRDVHLWDENTNAYALYIDPADIKSLSSNSCITTKIQSHISKTHSLQLFCLSGLFGEFQKDLFFNILDQSSTTLICLNIKTANIEVPRELNFAKLQTLTKILLSDVTLSHSTMMRLLSDSAHLHECFAMCTYCFKDEKCKCDTLSTDQAPVTNLVNTAIRRFECKFGSQMFRHVGNAENLKELNVANQKESEIVKDIARIIQTSTVLEKIFLHDIEPEVFTFPLPRDLASMKCLHLSEINISMEAVLTMLTDAEFTTESFTLRFDNVKLISGHIEELKEIIGQSKTFRIDIFKKSWKRRGNFRRTTYSSSPATNLEAVFSMALSKINKDR